MSSKTSDLLAVAVIGAGHFGRHHVRHYANLQNVEFKGILDQNAAQAQALCDEHGGQVFSTIAELQTAGVQAVTLATPAETHLELGLQLLEAGIAVLIEKPLATTVTDCEKLLQKQQQTGTPLMVGHIERFNPVITTLRSHMAENNTQPQFISINRQFPYPTRMGNTGIVLDLLVHDTDLALHLTNSQFTQKSLLTRADVSEVSDLANFHGQTASGAVVQLTTHWRSPQPQAQIEVITATHKYVGNLRDRTLTAFSHSDGNQAQLEMISDADALRAELTAFTQAVQNGQPMPTPAEAGLAAVDAALA